MTDIGHGRGWLNADAAASLWRIDAEIGHPLQITDAGRTWEQQKANWDAWQNGTGSFAAYPGTSPHEAGNAIDTNERLVEILHRHGWRRPLAFEPWHFVYWPNLDNHLNESVEDEMTPEQARQLEAVFQALFGAANVPANKTGKITWAKPFGEKPGEAHYGLLDIAIYSQALIAKNAGVLAALQTAVSQLSAGSGVALDMKAIEDAAERGARDALSGLTLTAKVD